MCSCKAWQSTGYPCGHALAIILARKEDPQTYAMPFFMLESYKKTYEHPIIHPRIVDISQPYRYQINTDVNINADDEVSSGTESSTDSDAVLPPNTRRPPGRPKKRRKRNQGETRRNGLPKRVQRCGRCRAIGHSRRTCTNAI